MGATTTQGTGPGSAEGLNKGPGNKRVIYQPANGAAILAAGEVFDTYGGWNFEVFIPGINEHPDNVTVIVTQSDWTYYDHRIGRGNEVAWHIEKFDQDGYNQEDSGYYYNDSNSYSIPGTCLPAWSPNAKFAGFVLHTGAPDYTDPGYPRKFGYVVVKTGGGKSFPNDPGDYC